MAGDLLVIGALMLVGWRFFPQDLAALRPSRLAPSAWLQHRYYRLGVALVLVLLLGWTVNLANVGWEGTLRLLWGQSPGDPACFRYQRQLEENFQTTGTRDLPADRLCPRRGILEFGPDGSLRCRQHGRAPEAQP